MACPSFSLCCRVLAWGLHLSIKILLKNIIMLTKIGKATFKCKACGETFEAIYTEGGIRAGINLPHCHKCGSGNTRKTGLTAFI